MNDKEATIPENEFPIPEKLVRHIHASLKLRVSHNQENTPRKTNISFLDIETFLKKYYFGKFKEDNPTLFDICIHAGISLHSKTINNAFPNSKVVDGKALPKYELLDFLCYAGLEKDLYTCLKDKFYEGVELYTLKLPDYAKVQLYYPEKNQDPAETKEILSETVDSENTILEEPIEYEKQTIAIPIVEKKDKVLRSYLKKVSVTVVLTIVVTMLLAKYIQRERTTQTHSTDSTSNQIHDNLYGNGTAHIFVERSKDDKKEKVFKTEKIGSQLWLVGNLDVEKYNNGWSIQEAKSVLEWKEFCSKKYGCWCYCDFNKDNSGHGKIYNWYAVIDTENGGIAPEGYRIPWCVDYMDLINYLQEGDSGRIVSNSSINEYIKDSSIWELGGAINDSGKFILKGTRGFWWATGVPAHNTDFFALVIANPKWFAVNRYSDRSGFFVRCISKLSKPGIIQRSIQEKSKKKKKGKTDPNNRLPHKAHSD